MFFELRMQDAGPPGNAAGAVPCGRWTLVAGSRQVAECTLLHWASLEQCNQPAPASCHERWLMTPSSAWDGPPEPGGALHELRILDVLNGHLPLATASLKAVDLPLLRTLGARVQGVYDVALGPMLPRVVLLLGWPDFATQQRAWARLDVEPRLLGARSREAAAVGEPLFSAQEQYLMQPVAATP